MFQAIRTHRVVRYTLAAQAMLLTLLTCCAIIRPSYWYARNEGGVSNYATGSTATLYFLAFASCSVLLLVAAHAMPEHLTPVARMLCWLSVLYLSVLLSTYGYQRYDVVDLLHTAVSIALFAAEVGFAYRLVALARSRLTILLFGWQLLGALVLLLSLLGIVRLMFVGEMTASFAFGALLASAITRLVTQ